MPETNSEDRIDARAAMHAAVPNPNLVLVVGNSPVNRVVVARIAERVGLQALSETPDSAATTLLSRLPATVILDGGPEDGDCAALMESLGSRRLATGGRSPLVILLSNRTRPADDRPAGGIIDAVVTKPIIPDRLQPLLQDMMDRLRDD